MVGHKDAACPAYIESNMREGAGGWAGESLKTKTGVSSSICGKIYILDVLCPVKRKGSYQGKTNCTATTSKILIHNLTHPTVEDWTSLGKID